ncbi:APC family permease [Streptomyces polygonati]|uniref:APC family permease n=1 Tax=Streptomyces polygonati TaxID=1617087 RepID=A0ABV8HHQ3_9ACTN
MPDNGEAGVPATDARLIRTLTTPKIVFLIVAAAAPLAAMVCTVPLAFALGNGPGVPAMFAFAGLTLLCFSVGYGAMSRHIVNAGGFYTYVSSGLGRPPAVGAGMIAVVAYNTATVGLAGAFAYFAQLVAASHGLDLRWEIWAALGLVLVGFLGYREINLSARVLSVFMVCEVLVLIALDIAVLARHGFGSLPRTSFAPSNFTATGVGVAMMFGFVSFIGFESAALYGEEARDPKRSVPRATYISVALISLFYAITSWLAVGAIGPSKVGSVATSQLGDMFFNLSDDYLDSAATTIMQILLCTSLLAGWLALHNAANRYMFVMGRERLLPRWLDAVHSRHNAVHRASVVQTVFAVVVVAAFAAAGLDPYTSLATSMLGLGTLGIIVLQALASLSVLGFYRKRSDRHWWRTGLAPLLGLAGLGTATVLVVSNFKIMTGTTNVVINAMPWLILAAGVGGLGYAAWLRSNRPEQYAAIAPAVTAEGKASASPASEAPDAPETPTAFAGRTRG